ncbi:MAG: 3-deoxy-manno-octulosonate-8-phosphatase KdsC [Candidatus Competibacteraceae bacterium]|nr:3-deoxy-manno-octulosonate-8-phosphatase KdsC [Candidatus Competibacteraceae bacterium]
MEVRPLDIRQRAARIRLLVLDVDGVLTDGRLYFGNNGEELKAFHIRDGHGIKMLQRHGVEVAVISGRHAPATQRRMSDLGVGHILLGVDNKAAALQALLQQLDLTPEEAAFVGDDLIDLPALIRVGLAVAVADADAFVALHAHWRTHSRGGHGAVREVCELILEARGLLDQERTRYL